MTRLIGAPLNAGNLTKSQAHSSVAALCDVPRVIGGSNRLYYELVTGKVPEGSAQCSPSRACGGVGHDHTGGGMGRPFKHTIYAVGYPDKSSDAVSVTPPAIYRAAVATYGKAVVPYIVPIPAAFTGSEYSSVSMTAAFRCTTFNSNVTLSGEFVNDQIHGGGAGEQFTISITAAGVYAVGTPIKVPVITGTYNRIYLKFWIANATATVVYLMAFAVAQLEA
jgi:hypothetical protein